MDCVCQLISATPSVYDVLGSEFTHCDARGCFNLPELYNPASANGASPLAAAVCLTLALATLFALKPPATRAHKHE